MTDFFKITLLVVVILWTENSLAEQKTWLEPVTSMSFVAVPKGCFQMGNKADALTGMNDKLQPYYANLIADEQPHHEVCLDSFWLGQFEVRASEWEKVMQAPPPSGRGAEPVGNISFKEAQAFAQRLTQLSNGQFHFRLPTEAEWEYACRANQADKEQPYHDNRVDLAWYSTKNHRVMQPSEVGQLKSNAWGLYDMLGNVWEWVEDSYQVDSYQHHSLYNPVINRGDNSERVIRGASHRSDYLQIRCTNRSSFPAKDRLTQIGFRLVRQKLGHK